MDRLAFSFLALLNLDFLVFLDLELMIIILNFIILKKNIHHLDIFSMIKRIIGPQRCTSHLSNNDYPLGSTHEF
jgi:hypothetical protein